MKGEAMDTEQQLNESEESNAAGMDLVPASNAAIVAMDMTPPQMLAHLVQKGDLASAEKFMALAERWEANEARKAYARALTQFSSKCPTIEKTEKVDFENRAGVRTFYKHAGLAGTIEQIRALMAECKLSHSWRTPTTLPTVEVECILTHEDGHSEKTSMSAPPDSTGGKNAVQQIASTVTMLQRYTMASLLGLAAATKDDDGRGGAPSENNAPRSASLMNDEPPNGNLKSGPYQEHAQAAPHVADEPPGPAHEPDAPPVATRQQQPAPQPAAPDPVAAPSADGIAKKAFALACDTWGLDAKILEQGQKFGKDQYQGLLLQAQSISGKTSIADCATWAATEARGIVSEEHGLRFI